MFVGRKTLPAWTKSGFGSLGSKNLQLFHVGRSGEQFLCLLKESLRNLAFEMRVSAGAVLEGIEDAVAAGAKLDRIPGAGAGLAEGQRLGQLQKLFDFFFLA